MERTIFFFKKDQKCEKNTKLFLIPAIQQSVIANIVLRCFEK